MDTPPQDGCAYRLFSLFTHGEMLSMADLEVNPPQGSSQERKPNQRKHGIGSGGGVLTTTRCPVVRQQQRERESRIMSRPSPNDLSNITFHRESKATIQERRFDFRHLS